MISITEIEKLASLARIELTTAEKENFTKQIHAILGYVDQLKQVSVTKSSDINHTVVNVFREDTVPHASGEYTEALLAVAPAREGQYVRVKKIIG
jgi:aspartyl-tRNA(Asn)/glutamyl-tRNA(Gln) amidotransferase subunit C